MNFCMCGSPYERMNVSGRHRTCGSSFACSAVRFLTSSAAHGWYGSPPGRVAPMLMASRDNGNSTPHSRKSSPAALLHGIGLPVSQMPEKSGLPLLRGAGAPKLTLPSFVRGTPVVGYFSHCPDAGLTQTPMATIARTWNIRTRMPGLRERAILSRPWPPRRLRLLGRVGVVGSDPRQHVGGQAIRQIEMPESASDGDSDEHDDTAGEIQQHPRHGGTSVLSARAPILDPRRRRDRAQP